MTFRLSKEDVQARIVALIPESPIDMSTIPSMYEHKFGQKLELKQFGTAKLGKFLQAIPSIRIEDLDSAKCVWRHKINGNAKIISDAVSNKSKSSISREELEARIERLILECKEVNMSQVPLLYSNKYEEKLDLSPFGGLKLKDILKGISTLSIHVSNGKSVDRVFWKGAALAIPTSQCNDREEDATKGGLKSSFRSVELAVGDTIRNLLTYDQTVERKLRKGHVDEVGDEITYDADKRENEVSLKAPMPEPIGSYFSPKRSDDSGNFFALSLSDQANASSFQEGALLGYLMNVDKPSENPVYMNTHDPFCFAAVGVQGAGKSHSLSCILESCLMPRGIDGVLSIKKPMTALVLHYDQNTTSICEATGLIMPAPYLEERFASMENPPLCLPRSKLIVLVSPSYFRQRKVFYDEYCDVRPLLFRWNSLTADHIKRIMRIQKGDNQLYVASFMSLLRRYQRQAVVPRFSEFVKEVKDICTIKGQDGPLKQRIALLESVVAESELNEDLCNEGLDLTGCTEEGYKLIVADMTDPLLSKEEANGMFQVLTEHFRTLPTSGGKVLALDEAHKFMDGVESDGLSEAIVNVARLMRHDGMRLAVSTQSPRALAPELLELVTVAMLHRFHSLDWWQYLQKKIPLADTAWENIPSLKCGDALVFASCHNLTKESVAGSHVLPINVRPKITADRGASKRNT